MGSGAAAGTTWSRGSRALGPEEALAGWGGRGAPWGRPACSPPPAFPSCAWLGPSARPGADRQTGCWAESEVRSGMWSQVQSLLPVLGRGAGGLGTCHCDRQEQARATSQAGPGAGPTRLCFREHRMGTGVLAPSHGNDQTRMSIRPKLFTPARCPSSAGGRWGLREAARPQSWHHRRPQPFPGLRPSERQRGAVSRGWDRGAQTPRRWRGRHTGLGWAAAHRASGWASCCPAGSAGAGGIPLALSMFLTWAQCARSSG